MLPLGIALAALVNCVAIDGDTIRCGRERVRLIGIDAPEMPGHCRAGRICVPGDPVAAKSNLSAIIRGRKIRLRRVGVDGYGRTLAIAYAGRVNLSCAQIAAGQAVYVSKWDAGGVVRQSCPAYSQAMPSPSRSSRRE